MRVRLNTCGGVNRSSHVAVTNVTLQDAPVARDENVTSNSGVSHLQEDREELLRSMLSEEGDAYRNVPSAPEVGDVRRVSEWELAGVKMMRYSPRRPADQNCKVCTVLPSSRASVRIQNVHKFGQPTQVRGGPGRLSSFWTLAAHLPRCVD